MGMGQVDSGITLNEKTVHRWVMSLHICSRLMKDVADFKDSSSVEITTREEELASRIKYDKNDRQVIGKMADLHRSLEYSKPSCERSLWTYIYR